MIRCLLALLACSMVSPAQAGNVLRVAPSGAPYTSIQSAVSAATSGDIVLVSKGTYQGFAIFDKSVVVVGEAPVGVIVTSGVTITGLASQHVVTLRNLFVVSDSLPAVGPALPAVLISTSAGNVRIEHCELTGARHFRDSQGTAHSATEGLRVENTSQVSAPTVALFGCILKGGAHPYDIGGVIAVNYAADGGAGLRAENATLSIYSTESAGGFAGHFVGTGGSAGRGGDGIVAVDCTVLLDTVTAYGAAGGIESGCDWFGSFLDPGDGGHGLSASFTSIRQRSSYFFYGPAGYNCDNEWGTDGQQTAFGLGAWMTELGGWDVLQLVSTPVAVGKQVTHDFYGQVGDGVFLAVSPAVQGWFFSPKFQSTYLLGQPLWTFYFGVLPATGTSGFSGRSTVSFIVPPLGIAGVNLHLQAFFLGANGSVQLSNFSEEVLLDPAHY